MSLGQGVVAEATVTSHNQHTEGTEEHFSTAGDTES